MLGSVQDAEDALQETLVRAWRGIAGLRDAASARAWLYSIATNVCLTELAQRRRRVLPHDLGPPAEDHAPPGLPAAESAWIDPYPEVTVGLASGKASPEARYEQHEAIELAFIAALQHLTPNQRAVLMLRDVLGFSADEAATMLDATLPSVNSALQRARSTVSARIPTRTQQETVRAIGDRELHTLVDRYVAAWERCDVDAFAALLVEDASFAMPPLTTWYAPREAVVAWARDFSLSGTWRWKTVLTSANAQPALGFYSWDEAAGGHLPFALNVLTLRDGLISDVTAFIARDTRASQPDAYIRFPEQPMNSQKLNSTFDRFGLPDRLA
jgi:RNA polymerase sigma-70 factor (ECF subfamily)